MAAVEDAVRQAGEAAPNERTQRLAQSTRRRLVRAGAASTAMYFAPTLRTVSLAQVACPSPGLPQLTKTIAAEQKSSNEWRITGVITLLNTTCAGIVVLRLSDQLIGLPSGSGQSTFLGNAVSCIAHLKSSLTLEPGQCADVDYSIFLSGFTGGTITNVATVEYRFVSATEVQSIEVRRQITLSSSG